LKTSFIALHIDTLTDRDGVAAITQSPSGASKSERFEWPLPEDLGKQIVQWQDNSTKGPPQQIGKMLFDHIVRGSVRDVLAAAMRESRASQRTLIAISSAVPHVHTLPFEILHDGLGYLQAGNRVIFRHIDDGASIEPRLGAVDRVLVVLAQPSEYDAWGHDEFANSFESFLTEWHVDYRLFRHAKPQDVHDHLVSERSAGRKYDIVLAVAHGEPAENGTDGYLVLEDLGGAPAPLNASKLATSLAGHEGCILILLSCNTGSVRATNALASVAHQSIHSGPAGAVIAMQRLITVDANLDIGKSIFNSLKLNNDIFNAFRDGINLPTISTDEHGTPCLYARLPVWIAPSLARVWEEYDERLVIMSLFRAPQPERCRFTFSLANFFMGVHSAEIRNNPTCQIKAPDGVFHYKGATVASADLGSLQGIIALLGRILPPDEFNGRISVISDGELNSTLKQADVSHAFVFGSRSHQLARQALNVYGGGFSFEYDDKLWHIVDRRTGKRYSAPDPSKSIERAEEAGDDYAIIEKVIVPDGRVIFFIAGFWDTSTLTAGQYLVSRRREIVADFGSGGFEILLKTAAGFTMVRDVVEKRRPSPP